MRASSPAVAAPMATSMNTVERLVDLLSTPGAPQPQTIETHISWVVLHEAMAYKLKKPVRFEFLDYSTLAAREAACREELRLNQRLAHAMYLDVVPLVETPQQSLAINASGVVVDWLVRMRRFPEHRTLDRLIATSRLEPRHVAQVSETLTEFYRSLPAEAIEPAEYCREITAHVRANAAELSRPAHQLPREIVCRVHARQLECLALDRQAFAARANQGRIVEGHGDLRPEHIVFTEEGDVWVFDALEFNREFRTLDVVDELCFLAMECDFLGEPSVGQACLDAFGSNSGDAPPARLLSFYKAYRACVRAKVAALRIAQLEQGHRAEATRKLHSYLHLADRYAADLGHGFLLVVGGLMGSGKSTLAAEMAIQLGAEHLSSDALRRELHGASQQRAAYGSGIYSSRKRAEVYRALLDRAAALLDQGCSVILDATFNDATWREAASDLARDMHLPCVHYECRCPAEIAEARIAWRSSQGNSDSEGRVEMLAQQRAEHTPSSIPLSSIDTTRALDEQVELALAALRTALV